MRVLLIAGCLAALIAPAYAQVSPLCGTTGTPAGVQSPAVVRSPAGEVTPRATRPRPTRTGRTLQERFEAANTARDGRLTPEQAAAMPAVARNFEAIDTGRKGYVTIDDIRGYNRAKRAERRAEKPR